MNILSLLQILSSIVLILACQNSMILTHLNEEKNLYCPDKFSCSPVRIPAASYFSSVAVFAFTNLVACECLLSQVLGSSHGPLVSVML